MPRWLLNVLVSLGTVLFLALNIDWPRVQETLASVDLHLLASALAVFAVTVPCGAERWRAATSAASVNLAAGFFLRGTFASMFVGQFLLAGVGTDAARITFLWRQNVPFPGALQSVVIDRIAGLAGVFLVMAMGLPFVLGSIPSPIVTTAATTAALLLAAAAAVLLSDKLPLPDRLRSRKVGTLLIVVRDTRAALATKPALRALAYAISIHLLGVATILLIARSFGYPLRFSELMTVSAFAIFAALLPISINGWGVREGAMVLGLSVLGVGKEAAFLISFLYGIVLALVALPGAFLWYRMRPLDKQRVS